MSEVKIWRQAEIDYAFNHFLPSTPKEFVSFSDYENLEEELAQAKSRIAELEKLVAQTSYDPDATYKRIKELESELSSALREVERLKKDLQAVAPVSIALIKSGERNVALIAERDRYRSALEKIDRVEFKNIDDVLEIASEALKPEGE